MLSIFSTQNLQTFLRRKYCFLPPGPVPAPPFSPAPFGGPALLFLSSAIIVSVPLPYGRGSVLLLQRRFRRGQGYGRWRRFGRSGRGLADRALFPFLLEFVQPLQLLVDAHGEKLDDSVTDAQPPLQLLHRVGRFFGGELQQDVVTLAVFSHPVSQPALAPLVDLVHGPPG